MSHDPENPYRSPSGDASAQDAPPDWPPAMSALVRRGKLVFLGVAAVVLLNQAGGFLENNARLSILRILFSVALLLAVWWGHSGAMVLLALGFALHLLIAVVEAAWAYSDGQTLRASLLFAEAVVSGALLVCFVRSRSLNAFIAERERLRTQPARDAAERPQEGAPPFVTLTPRAAAHARLVIKERKYPRDSAVRISAADEAGALFQVEYDLPRPDATDWQVTSQGLTVLVSAGLAGRVDGLVVDCQAGAFTFKMSRL